MDDTELNTLPILSQRQSCVGLNLRVIDHRTENNYLSGNKVTLAKFGFTKVDNEKYKL